MRINKGSTRIAVSGKNLTAKIPYFPLERIKGIPKDLQFLWKLHKWKGLLKYLTDPIDNTCFQQKFISGWQANIREFLHSKNLKDMVIPTHFSLIGLLNIQSAAENCNFNSGTVLNTMKAEIKDHISDAHTFLNSDNYGKHQNRVKLLDYGARGARNFIKTHQTAFRKALTTLTKMEPSHANPSRAETHPPLSKPPLP